MSGQTDGQTLCNSKHRAYSIARVKLVPRPIICRAWEFDPWNPSMSLSSKVRLPCLRAATEKHTDAVAQSSALFVGDFGARCMRQFIQRKESTYESCKENTVWSFDRLNHYINNNLAAGKDVEQDWVFKTLTVCYVWRTSTMLAVCNTVVRRANSL